MMNWRWITDNDWTTIGMVVPVLIGLGVSAFFLFRVGPEGPPGMTLRTTYEWVPHPPTSDD